MAGGHAGDMNAAGLSRAMLALLIGAVLVVGVVLGGAVSAFGDDRATPSPTPSPTPVPTAAALPARDVDGDDLERLPRFPGSVRTEYEVSRDDRYRLTAAEYLADATVAEVRRFYQRVIDDHGWERADVNYAGGEWTYVLVDGRTEALIEIEESKGLVEIDLQISEPIASPRPDPTPSPSPSPSPGPAAPPPAPPAPSPSQDDDDDDGDDDDEWTEWSEWSDSDG